MSKTASLMEDLLAGRKITNFDAFVRYEATRLSGLVFSLRRQGFPIQTKLISDADGVKYAAYFIHKDKLKQIKKQWRNKNG